MIQSEIHFEALQACRKCTDEKIQNYMKNLENFDFELWEPILASKVASGGEMKYGKKFEFFFREMS